MRNSEIEALVSLLDDEDQEILRHVEQKIMALGSVTIPFLESEWERSFNSNVQERIEDLIHDLQFTELKKKLTTWKEKESDNLLKGMYLIATYQYPDWKYEKLEKEIEKIYYEIWLSHRTYASPHDQIRNINNVLFDKFNFIPNTQNFHSPANSMLNMVLESKKGNPISLCTIYILLAQKLKMPIYGVNLPNLFIMTYKSTETQFYINAFNRGVIFPKDEITNYLEQLKIKPNKLFYEPCTNLDILQRVLRNLAISFEKLGEIDKMQEIEMLLEVL